MFYFIFIMAAELDDSVLIMTAQLDNSFISEGTRSGFQVVLLVACNGGTVELVSQVPVSYNVLTA
jgi:hypothetical protein